MIPCPWEEIIKFNGWHEFDRFCNWIKEQVIEGNAEEIPMQFQYNNSCDFEEKWYIHKLSGEIWRLVTPDPPFAGVFKKIDFDNPHDLG